MARIGGRSTWLAVPAGLLCAGVVAALVYLAVPMVPVAITWAGEALRTATAPRPTPTVEATPAQLAAQGSAIDCRTLYPDVLWAELSWKGGALLSQSKAPPATAVTSLTEALAPTPQVTCSWRLDTGAGIVTTLAAVADGAADIAGEALRGAGFSCDSDAGALRCQRARGDVIEEHTLRGGLWLSSIESAWHPEHYGARVEAHVWDLETSQDG
jgi:hypothetical protein